MTFLFWSLLAEMLLASNTDTVSNASAFVVNWLFLSLREGANFPRFS